MRTKKNEISIVRGESWTFNKRVVNNDGSPYIISNKLSNPYFLFKISSSRYDQQNRYSLNKWLSLNNFLRFESVKPKNLKDIHNDYTFENIGIPSGYEGDKSLGYANVAIFYLKDENGVIHYKYWEYINNIEDNYDGRWVEYTCPIITTFTSDLTETWIEGEYYYEINLVAGTSTTDALLDKYELHFRKRDESMSNEQLYDAIKTVDPSFTADLFRPIRNFDVKFTIQSPTNFTVRSTLN